MAMIFDKLKVFFGFEEEVDQGPTGPFGSRGESEPRTLPSSRGFKGALVHGNGGSGSLKEIKIEEPRIYEDSLNIATWLRDGKPVLINLKYLDGQAGKRLIDFVCGTAYAINGHMMKIGDNIFLFTPEHVLIVDSEEKSALEQGVEQEEKEIFFRKAASF